MSLRVQGTCNARSHFLSQNFEVSEGSNSVRPARCVHSDSCEGNSFAHGEKKIWTGQEATLATLFGRPENVRMTRPTRASCSMCATSVALIASSAASNEGDRQGRQHHLCRTWFQDNTRWCGNRDQKKNFRPPNFRHNESEEGLCVHNSYKPVWLDTQLATRIAPTDHSDLAASTSSSPANQLVSLGCENRLSPTFVKKLCQQGQVKGAVEVLQVLVGTNYGIDKHLLYFVLKESVAKKDLMLGSQVHEVALKMGFGSDTFLCNHFIRMYAGHGKLREVMSVFRGMALPDAFTWSAIISAHVKQGQAQRAIELYQHMRATRTEPDKYVFVAALQACAAAGDLQSGKQTHDDVLTYGLEHDMFISNSLVGMYSKCGSFKDARRVFDRLGEKNVVSWNAMLAGYAQQEGMGQEALSLYNAMYKQAMALPDRVTFMCVLQACANVGMSALEEGKQLHSQIKERRLESDMGVGGSLVNMYAKCGSLTDARNVFDRLSEKNVVIWTAMITGYAKQEGMGQEALSLYSAMYNQSTEIPDRVTFVCLLQACANVGLSALKKGKQLHSQIKERRLESGKAVGGSLVNMYAKCGSLTDARTVFDGLREKDVVIWSAMIAGYANAESMGQEALSLYSAMRSEGTEVPDRVTFVCLLQACANVGVPALGKGKQLHSELKARGHESDLVVGGSLVNMYAKCGSLTDARSVFDALGAKNVVTWTAMIAGYAQQEGMGQEALSLYSCMHNQGMVAPNAVTYICLLEACGSVGALQQGKQLHLDIKKGGFESDALIGTSLVKMYAQCGHLEVSREVFDRLPVKSLETWTAILNGYAEYGEGGNAIQCFGELLEHGIKPDEVTYICVLTACSRAGLFDQGQQYFETMEERHGVKPDDRHYTCMVDLLGRSGHLDRAEQMLRASGLAGDAVSWRALLSACSSYGDADLGKRCFDYLVNLQPTVATPYVLLGNIYANVGRWDEVERVEVLRKAAGARKKAAKACIEVKEEVHEFTVGEETSDVAASLRTMNTKVKEGGHVPHIQLVLRAVSEQEKQDALCGHAEKLALAYGLLNTPAGSPLLVIKNLRMCNDCHSSTRIMSRVEKRNIVVRDGHKVHRFHNGICSCQDRP